MLNAEYCSEVGTQIQQVSICWPELYDYFIGLCQGLLPNHLCIRSEGGVVGSNYIELVLMLHERARK